MNWFVASFFWLISLSALIYGLNLTKEIHKSTDYSVRPNLFNLSSDSSAGWFLGAIVTTVSTLFMGFFFRTLPWWLARTILFGVGIGMLFLGLKVLQY
ncbi:hypothetical protein M3231_23455 [Neobacillus mesonae]|nr:hypothetical protein [Neobacillus mesonae]